MTITWKLDVRRQTTSPRRSQRPGSSPERRRPDRSTVADVARARDEKMEPDLLRRLSAAVQAGTTILTIANSQPNKVVDIGPDGVWINTDKSSNERGPQLVPAWMLNEAWAHLTADRSLSNTDLIKTVKRSSAVLALLRQLPGVTVVSTRPVVLRLAT
ncbi:MAG: hypothetical protein JNK12_05385 [Acidimicrobiales bacterium]|nr:hypothetical protein [Acidimicrobiales bacterium]